MGFVYNFYGCEILRDDSIQKESLWIQDGRVIDPEKVNYEYDLAIDCTGVLISPGFIDLKVQGAYGSDFASAENVHKALNEVAAHLPATGVTYFCAGLESAELIKSARLAASTPAALASSVASSDASAASPSAFDVPSILAERYAKILPQCQKRPPTPELGAGILGWHLDGPFCSKGDPDNEVASTTFPLSVPHSNQAGDASGVDGVSRGVTSGIDTGQSQTTSGISAGSCTGSPGVTPPDLSCGYNGLTDIYGQNLESVKVITLAPELPGALEAIAGLKENKIIASIGHSRAAIEEAEEAVRRGARMITHIFTEMPMYHHRDPGIVGLLASDVVENLDVRSIDEAASRGSASSGGSSNPSLQFTIISDYYHVHGATLKMAYMLGKDNLILVTDGQAPLGLGPGKFTIGNRRVVVSLDEKGNTKCALQNDSTALWGSACPLNRAARLLMERTSCSAAYALAAASKRPAQAMAIFPQKGSLRFGADADFVLLQPETFDVHATFIAGQKYYDAGTTAQLAEMPLASSPASEHSKRPRNA